YKEITKDDYDLVTFGAYKAEEHDKPVFKKNTQYTVTVPKDHFAHELRTNFSFVVWNKIYKRSVIASVRFDTELFGTDDAYFNICISHLIKRYAAIDARLYCWRQYVSSSSKSRITAQKIVDGLYKITEKIHCSTQTPAFSSQEQRLFSSCMFISLLSSHVIVNYGCDEFFYTSKLINDLYSRGLIDFSHSKSFLEKIIVAPFIIVGKVQNLFGSSK
ncbi:MAG: hypothetical protein LBB21_04755, partial [Holosporaceae bacterium]|nr:hypothetical protein [Holosporaceae bacterium]